MSNFVGFQSAGAASVSVPSHSNGDLLVGMFYNGAGAAAPSLPSGWTNIFGIATAPGIRLCYRVSDGTVSSVASTNATAMGVWAFTSPDATPIGGQANTAPTSAANITLPSVTLADSDGSSWRVAIGYAEGTGLTATPSALSLRASLESGGRSFFFFDEANITSGTFDTATLAPGGTYNVRGSTIEVRLVPVSGGNKFRPYFITG